MATAPPDPSVLKQRPVDTRPGATRPPARLYGTHGTGPAHICHLSASSIEHRGPDCLILDERQYVGWDGQRWTTLAGLRAAGHRGRLAEEGPGVVGIGADPPTAIGQRALLLRDRAATCSGT